MRQNDKLLRIAGTLKYGAFSGEKRKKLILAYCLLCAFFLFGIIFAVVMLSLEQASSPNPLATFVVAIVGIILGLSAVPVILLIMIWHNEKMRKDILLWLEDAVEVKADCKVLDVWNPTILFPAIKIQVAFEIEGKKFSYVSENKQLGGGVPKGYHYIWSKYADKKIDVLYSSKFDQVLILKPSQKTN